MFRAISPPTPLSTATKPWPHCDMPPSRMGSHRELLSTATKPWPHCDSSPFPPAVPPAGRSPRLQSRGPIATAHAAAGPPGRTALSTATKPWPHCDGMTSHSRAPPSTRVSRPAAASRSPLHGYKAVAPLRRSVTRRPGCARRLSTATKPWPHCDGCRARVHRDVVCSPRLQSRGPIATKRECVECGATDGSPRLQSRGPIATRSSPRPGAWSAALHGYKAVAPLRHFYPSLSMNAQCLSTATKPWPHCDAQVWDALGSANTFGALHGYKAVAPLRR